jgi:hypothetical protein
MLRAKGGRAFPYCVIMDSAGQVLTTLRPTSPEVVQSALERAEIAISLRAKLEENPQDAAAEAGLKILAALTARKPPPLAEVDGFAKTEGLDERVAALYREGRDAFVDKLNNHRVRAALTQAFRAMRTGVGREEAFAKRDTDLLAMYREGLEFPATHRIATGYYGSVIAGALAVGDVETAKKLLPTFEEATAAVIAKLGPNSRRTPALEKQVANLKARVAAAEAAEAPPKDEY